MPYRRIGYLIAHELRLLLVIDVENQRIELYEEPDVESGIYNRKMTYFLDDEAPVVIKGDTVGTIAVADLFPS